MNTRKSWSELIKFAEDCDHSEPPQVPEHEAYKHPDYANIPQSSLQRGSHDDIALLFVERYADTVRNVPERGWVYRDGHVWRQDANTKKAGAVATLLRELLREVATVHSDVESILTLERVAEQNKDKKDKDKKDPAKEAEAASRKTYNYFVSRQFHSLVMNYIETDPRLVTPLDAFDANSLELNTPGGVVDLRTGEISEPRAGALNLRSTTVAPDASLPTPKWDTFLDQTFQGDQALIDYVQRMIGVSLLKAQTEQVFMYMHGTGANGKDTIMNIIQSLLGTGHQGYSLTVDSTMLVEGKFDAHPTEIAQLAGVRMAVTSEVPEDRKVDTAKIKKLSGGGVLSARFTAQDHFSFEATHTMWIMANDRLKAPASDAAFFRRLREVPFNNVVPQGQRISGLDKIIVSEEGPGVLAWMVQGANKYLSEGLDVPVAVLMANDAYKAEQDTVSQFLEDQCEFSAGSFTSSKDLFSTYVRWCKEDNLTPVKRVDMKKEVLTKPGITEHRNSSERGFLGILVKYGNNL